MGGRGNCCTSPYASDDTYHRIMLRFRPIAPKPAPSFTAAAGGSSSRGSSPDSNKGSQTRSSTRCRRRYVPTASSKKEKKKKEEEEETARGFSSMQEEETKGAKSTATPPDKVTLSLLPPPYDHQGNYDNSRVVCGDNVTDTKEGKPSLMLSGDGNYDLAPGFGNIVETTGGESEGGIGAVVVVVECVTESWGVEGNGMGVTDEGRVRRMREDTCPCFISDGEGRVRWLNEAFRRMVVETTGGGGGGGGGVGLVMREEVGVGAGRRCFGCRVRVVSTWRGMKMRSMTFPCDVWRMDCGYLAWRLDVGAALRLGL